MLFLTTRGRWRLILGAAAAVVVVVVEFRDGVRCLQTHIAVCRNGGQGGGSKQVTGASSSVSRQYLGERYHVSRWLCGGREWVRGCFRGIALRRSDLRSTCDARMVADVGCGQWLGTPQTAETADWMRCNVLTQLAG